MHMLNLDLFTFQQFTSENYLYNFCSFRLFNKMPKVYHAGDKVIDMCEPFVIQLDDEHYDIRCHYCMKIRLVTHLAP